MVSSPEILFSDVLPTPSGVELEPCPRCKRSILQDDKPFVPKRYTFWALPDRWSVEIGCKCGFRALAYSYVSKDKALEFAVAQWNKNVTAYILKSFSSSRSLSYSRRHEYDPDEMQDFTGMSAGEFSVSIGEW